MRCSAFCGIQDGFFGFDGWTGDGGRETGDGETGDGRRETGDGETGDGRRETVDGRRGDVLRMPACQTKLSELGFMGLV